MKMDTPVLKNNFALSLLNCSLQKLFGVGFVFYFFPLRVDLSGFVTKALVLELLLIWVSPVWDPITYSVKTFFIHSVIIEY